MVFLFLDFLKPVGDALRFPFEVGLGVLAKAFDVFPPTHFIGAYGLAIIVVTVAIKTLLFPLFQTQLRLTKKTQAEQRKVQPQLQELRKKYKKDPAKLNQETMALYKEHNINPLSSIAGCLPTLLQLPVLIGLYQAIIDRGHFESLHVSPFFLGLDLSIPASLNSPVTWILPVLAGLTTFVQSRMMTPPKVEGDDPQAQQMAQVSQSMSLMMPLLITFFAFQKYALQGMVLYWIISNIYSIGQQYSVNGWGQLPILGSRQAPPTSGNGGSRGDGGQGGGGGNRRRQNNRNRRGGKRRQAKVPVGAAEVSPSGGRRA